MSAGDKAPGVKLLSNAEYDNMNEEQKEAHREKSKWAGYVPPEKRRPTDEFFDLNTLATDCVRVEIVGTDYSVVKRV